MATPMDHCWVHQHAAGRRCTCGPTSWSWTGALDDTLCRRSYMATRIESMHWLVRVTDIIHNSIPGKKSCHTITHSFFPPHRPQTHTLSSPLPFPLPGRVLGINDYFPISAMNYFHLLLPTVTCRTVGCLCLFGQLGTCLGHYSGEMCPCALHPSHGLSPMCPDKGTWHHRCLMPQYVHADWSKITKFSLQSYSF